MWEPIRKIFRTENSPLVTAAKPAQDIADALRKRIGSAIKSARDARSVTQKQLADAVGVSQGQISKYEAGTDLPGIDGLISIASTLGVSLDVIVGNKEPVESQTVIVRRGRHTEGMSSELDLLKIPLISIEIASRWKAMALAVKEVRGYVYAPLAHFRRRESHRLACIRTKAGVPPLITAGAIVALDFTDLPSKGIKGSDRGIFLTTDRNEVRICRAIISGNSLILADDPVRSVDLRRHRNPLSARVVWVSQPVAPFSDFDNSIQI